MVDLRPYHHPVDAAAVYALWQATAGHEWPSVAADFQRLLTDSPQYQQGDYLAACVGVAEA